MLCYTKYDSGCNRVGYFLINLYSGIKENICSKGKTLYCNETELVSQYLNSEGYRLIPDAELILK